MNFDISNPVDPNLRGSRSLGEQLLNETLLQASNP